MATLNRDAAEVARRFGVRAVTDVTGFGLLGHLSEMCRASRVGADLWLDRLPLLPGVEELAREGVVPGGTKRNLEYVVAFTEFEAAIEDWWRLIAADAQTSGGLLLAVAEERVFQVVEALEEKGVPAAAVIGKIREEGGPMLRVSLSGDSGG